MGKRKKKITEETEAKKEKQGGDKKEDTVEKTVRKIGRRNKEFGERDKRRLRWILNNNRGNRERKRVK